MAIDVATLSMRVDASGLVKGEQALNSLAATGGRTEAQVNKSASGMSNGFNKAAKQTGSATGKLGQQFQQSGYQVQDFAVQVASGQSAMTAFAQQAPQLLAGLGVAGVAGILLSLSATAIAVGSAMFMSLGEAEKFQDGIDALKDSVDGLNGALDLTTPANYDKVIEKYGSLNAEVRGHIDLLGQLNAKMISLSQVSATGLFKEQFGSYILTTQDELARAFSVSYDQARALERALSDIDNAVGPTAQIAAYDALIGMIIDMRGGVENLNAEQSKLVLGLASGRDAAMIAQQAFAGLAPPVTTAANEAERLAANLQRLPSVLDMTANLSAANAWVQNQGTGLAPTTSIRPKAAPNNVDGSDWNTKLTKPKAASGPKRDNYESAVLSLTGQTKALESQAAAMAGVTGAGRDLQYQLAQIAKEQDLLTAAQRAGKELTPQLRSEVSALASEYVSATRALDDMKLAQDDAANGRAELVSLLSSAKDGVDGFRSAIGRLADKLLDGALDRGLGMLIKGMSATGGGSWLSSAFSWLGGSIAGARANGGPVTAGSTYLVGERGPELFTAGRSGNIMSNDQLMRGGGGSGGGIAFSGGELILSDNGTISTKITYQAAQNSARITQNGLRSSARTLDRQNAHYQLRGTTT